jgi:murein DD-endopeptidase MepM/ murein hydrolase activator NlpD
MTNSLSRARKRVLCSTALMATLGSGLGLNDWLSSNGGINTPAGAAATVPVLAGPPITDLCSYYNTWLAPRSGGRQHQGVDIIAKAGVPLKAVVAGTIIKVNPDYPGSMAGNHVNLQAAGGKTYYVYLHLQSFAPGLAVGTKVNVGDVIGFVGTTGASSTPHLHFEVHPDGGSAIDPTPIVTAAGTCGVQGHDKPVPVTIPPASTTPPSATTKPPSTTKPPTTTIPKPTTTAPPAAASAGATRGKPAPPISGPKPAAPAPVAPAPVAPAPTAPKPVTPATTPVAPATTPAPATTVAPIATTPAPSLGLDVLLTGRVNAYETVSAQVVGGPGLPASASAVEVTITVASGSSGRAVVWPCGSPGNIETGTPLAVNAGETSTRVIVTPGVGGQICVMSELDAAFRVTIDSFR